MFLLMMGKNECSIITQRTAVSMTLLPIGTDLLKWQGMDYVTSNCEGKELHFGSSYSSCFIYSCKTNKMAMRFECGSILNVLPCYLVNI